MNTHSLEFSPPFAIFSCTLTQSFTPAHVYFCRKAFYKANVINKQLLPFCVPEGKNYSKLPNPTKRLTLSRKPFYIK